MSELNEIVFKESSYGCFAEMLDVVENWTAKNKDVGVVRSTHGHLQEIVNKTRKEPDGTETEVPELVNARTITLWCEKAAKAPKAVSGCDHGGVEETNVEATCMKPGYNVKICKDCCKTISRETFPAKGHQWKTDVIEEPTTEKEGLMETRCTVCDHVIRTLVLPKLPTEE